MTNEEIVKHLRMVADFLEQEDDKATGVFASIKLTTPLPRRQGDRFAFMDRNNISTLMLSSPVGKRDSK